MCVSGSPVEEMISLGMRQKLRNIQKFTGFMECVIDRKQVIEKGCVKRANGGSVHHAAKIHALFGGE